MRTELVNGSTGVTPTYEWTVGGSPSKSYTLDIDGGHMEQTGGTWNFVSEPIATTALVATDLAAQQISFYWTSEASSPVTITLSGANLLNATKTVSFGVTQAASLGSFGDTILN